MNQQLLRVGRSFARHGFLAVVTLVVLIPIYLVVINGLKTNQDILSNPFGIPWDRLSLTSLVRLIGDPTTNIIDAYAFTTTVTLLSIAGVVVLGSMIAYTIARTNRRLTRTLYSVLVAGLLVPAIVILIPAVRVLQLLGLLFTFPGLILFNVAFGLPFAVFLFTGFIRSIPTELDEAAWVDGAGPLRTFWRVIFPLLKPITATISIFLALSYWNDFITPLILLGPGRGYTITTGMYRAIGDYVSDYSTMYAWLWLTTVPMLIIFVLGQRWITAGLVSGSLKG